MTDLLGVQNLVSGSDLEYKYNIPGCDTFSLGLQDL